MPSITFTELIPPLVFRISRYLRHRLKSSILNNPAKLPPFDNLPKELEVKWVLDIGANVGDVAINSLKSYNNSHVICFEPVASTCISLSNRLREYGSRASIHNMALSDKAGEGKIHITTSHGANSIEIQSQLHKDCNPHVREISTEVIKLVRLDEYSKCFSCEIVDVMKVDVEGHELEVLNGGRSFISNRVRYIIIEISLMRDQTSDNQSLFPIFDFMNSVGFIFQNAFDFHRVNEGSLLVQMDCVFKNTKCL